MTSNEIIDKYLQDNPTLAESAKSYGLKKEFLEVDAFDEEERIVINDECFDKFTKVYGYTFGETAKKMLSDKNKISVEAILEWVNNHYDDAVKHYLDILFTEKIKGEVNFLELESKIVNVMDLCAFSPIPSKSNSKIKEIAAYLSSKYSNINWNKDESDLYNKLLASEYVKEGKYYTNKGLSNVLNSDDSDILSNLAYIKNIKDYLSSLKVKGTQVNSLLEEIDNYEVNYSTKLSYLYNRLYREGKLEEVISEPDKYFLSEQLKQYKIEDDALHNNDIKFDEEEKTPIISNEIRNDIYVCLEKYKGADYNDNSVKSNITLDVIDTLFSMKKNIYTPDSDEYNKDVLVNTIVSVLNENNIKVSEDTINFSVEKAEIDFYLEKSRIESRILNGDSEISKIESEDLLIDDKVLRDARDFLTSGIYTTLSVGSDEDKQKELYKLIEKIINNNKDIIDNKKAIVDSIYCVLRNWGVSRDNIEYIVNDITKEDTKDDEYKGIPDVYNKVYEIFNELPEKDTKSNLEELYELTSKDDYEALDRIVLSTYSQLLNDAMYGTSRNIETIEKAFRLFCSENGIDFTDDFIDSLPSEFKTRYSNPIIEKENISKKGEEFKIVKRYTPKTSIKTQKRFFATLAGVGIISFLYMTTVRIISPNDAANECTETFQRLLHNDVLGSIFGDVKTYFASIAASFGGTVGYVVKDEQDKKSKTK